MTSRSSLLAPLDGALRRPAALALHILALVALIGGSVAWSTAGKTVELAVDGEVRSVELRGDTVADVLDAAGLEAGEHDLLVPAETSEIEDGDRVALRRGRQIELVVDGQARTVWVTAASVDEALDQLGLRDDRLVLSASRSRSIPLSGMTLDVRLPKTVTVIADAVARPVTTAAATVADVLAEAGVVLGPTDRVSVPQEQAPTEGLVIAVSRVVLTEQTEDVAVPFATERREDGELTKGTTKTLQKGQTGLVRKVFRVETSDGTVTARTLLSEQQVRAPVTRIVAVGTKPKPAPARGGVAGADGLNWAALARCESGGNPRAVSPNGLYHGLYQFANSTWRGVGGSGSASQASPEEQTYRAKLLYSRSGRSPWPHCGKYL
jgi:uncharacterized protein YabE (DUF348 family)